MRVLLVKGRAYKTSPLRFGAQQVKFLIGLQDKEVLTSNHGIDGETRYYLRTSFWRALRLLRSGLARHETIIDKLFGE